MGMAATVIGLGGLIGALELVSGSKPAKPGESAYDSSDHTHYPDTLSKLVADGLEKDWKKVAVFPGMLVASPGARFFTGVDLKAEVDLGLAGSKRALILRPVFPAETFIMGSGKSYQGDDLKAVRAGGIDSDTFAFLHPATGGVVFCNYRQSVEDLDILTRIKADELSYTSQTNSNIPMQYVGIDVHKKMSTGLIIPAGISDESDDGIYPSDPYQTGSSTESAYSQKIINYYAIAQGRTYPAESVTYLIDRFMGDYDPVTVESSYGPKVPIATPTTIK